MTSSSAPSIGPTSPPQFAHRLQPQISTGRRRYFTHSSQKIEARRQGYPRLAAFINSDKDFVVFKAFGELRARTLLHKQDEIIQLEQKLNALDRDETTAYYLSARRLDENQERKDLLSIIEVKLREYDVLLKYYFRLVERPKVRPELVKNMCNWLEGNKPLAQSESTFMDDWDDLVSPNIPADKGSLEYFLERCIVKLIRHGFKRKDTAKSDDSHILLFSHSGIVALSRILTTLLAVMTLIGPIFLLFYVHRTTLRMWIITISAGIFSLALCSLTGSRKHELFSATAAFCAVMVVFVGSLPGNLPSFNDSTNA